MAAGAGTSGVRTSGVGTSGVRTSRVRPSIPALWSLVLALLVLGPLLGSGSLLLRDAVSVPRSYLTDSALGVSDAAARAVPQDAVTAVLSTVVDGGVVVKALLLLALWLAGWGVAAMVALVLPGAGVAAATTAATVAIWNPYVAERLLQGHWSLLIGYAALGWTVVAATRLRDELPGADASLRRWWPLALCLGAGGITPTGAILVTVMAVVILAAPGPRRGRHVAGALGLALIASAPWLAATAVSGGGTAADPAGVAAFAARAEPGLGTLLSLTGLGGIWNSDAVPPSRTTWFAGLGTAILLLVAVLGARYLWRRRTPVIAVLTLLGVASVLVCAAAATPWGLALGEWAAVHLPGAGLTRDAQKWVALWMPALALGAAAGVARWTTAGHRATIAAGASIVAVLVALPDLVWGVGGALRPVHYPQSWSAVAAEITDDGQVAVVPAGTFRVFPWSGDVPVLDPAPRLLPADVLQTGELPVAGGVVAGEGRRAEQVQDTVLSGGSIDDLARLGVDWILVEKTSQGPLGDSARTLDGQAPVFDDSELALYRVPDAASVETGSAARTVSILAHLAWAVLTVGAACLSGVSLLRRRHQTRGAAPGST